MTERCPLCATASSAPFLRRAGVPVLQNAPAHSAEAARARARGALEMVACSHCGFVFNAAFDPSAIEYASSYDNTQAHSTVFDDYTTGLARELIERHGLCGKRIVEVGCGKGHFLRRLCLLGDNDGFGFDPTYVGPSAVDGGKVTFVRELYGETHAALHADFVCCRHVLEHVANPLALLESVAMATRSTPGASVFFEVPTIDWILDHTAFWDLFYEHCNYFSADTLAFAFRRAGYAVSSVRPAFGGQYLWLEARAGAPASASAVDANDMVARTRAFAARTESAVAALRAQLERSAEAGGLAVWGAGAKGVTLVNLLDPDRRYVRYVIDINPAKQGMFIPGTGHAIVGPASLPGDPVRHLLVMNPRYLDEIRSELARLHMDDTELASI